MVSVETTGERGKGPIEEGVGGIRKRHPDTEARYAFLDRRVRHGAAFRVRSYTSVSRACLRSATRSS